MGGKDLDLSEHRVLYDDASGCLVDEEVSEPERPAGEMIGDREGREDRMTRQDGEARPQGTPVKRWTTKGR